jgi:Domain of unknown function (DUF4055)
MALNSTHPTYDASLEDWELMRDSYGGERVVKARGTKYLPATAAHILDGQGANNPNAKGEKDYQAYKLRAVFPDYVREAVEYYVGLLHQKPAQIELPAALEPLLKKATNAGEGLQLLLRRINVEQLMTGRLGMLLDMPVNPDPATPMPYIALYAGETIINWDDSNDSQGVNSLEVVVLNESGPIRREDMTWVEVERFRVLKLVPKVTQAEAVGPTRDGVVTVEPAGRIYKQNVFELKGSELDDTLLSPPVYRGKALEQVPFVFVNSKDIVSTPDLPPLLGLARLCMCIYRGEADYRHTLYMQGQDTLVTIGGVIDPETGATDSVGLTSDGIRVGAGARIDLNIGGDAKYIGVGSDGLGEQRQALESDRKQAETKAGQMISPTAGRQESGDALSTRLSAQTASLNQIAKAGAAALENLLKIAAEWMGANPAEVSVIPNLEFVEKNLPSKDVVDWMTARTMGAPISLGTIHENLASRGVTRKTLEEELDAIAEEDAASAQRTAALVAVLPTPTTAPIPQPARSPAPAPNGGT